MIGAGTGRDGRAVKVSLGALLEGRGAGARGGSCLVMACPVESVNRGSSAKRMRPWGGGAGLADPAPVSG